jgi:hypothetical protein
MATRIYYQNESTGESSTSSTDYQDKCTLQFTPGDSENWLIIATWLLMGSSESYTAKSKLARTSGTPTDLNEQIFYPKDIDDYLSGHCFAVEAFGSSPSQQTYKIQYASGDSGATAYIKEAKIIAIRLESNDKYNLSTSRTTNTGDANWHDKVSLVFTPPSSGDYLILANAVLDLNGAADWKARVDIDASLQYDTTNKQPINVDNRECWGSVRKRTLDASEHTLKIQFASQFTSNTVGIAYAYIIALRLGDFPASYYSEAESYVTTQSTEWQDLTTLVQTLNALDHLVLGKSGWTITSTTRSCSHQLTQDAVCLGEMLGEGVDIANRNIAYVCAKFLEATAKSYTWKLQYHVEHVSYTAGSQENRIVVLQLEEESAATTAPMPTFRPSLL